MSSSAERVAAGTVLRPGDGPAEHATLPFLLDQAPGEAASPRTNRSAAHAEGYATGWAQGMREARAATAGARQRAEDELDRMLRDRDERARQALSALRASAEQVRATTVQRAEEILDSMVTAAVELAEAMASAAVGADLVGAARQSMRRALDALPAATPVTVRLNPADHAELAAAGTAELAPGMAVTLVADPAVERGGAIAATDVTTVDATLSAAVRRVRAELTT